MPPFRDPDTSHPLIMSIDGKLLAVAPLTGEVQWEHDLDAGGTPTTLVVTETRIYACCPPALACLEYPTGSLKWSAKIPRGSTATMVLDRGLLFVATQRGELDCFSEDGQHVWHNPLKGKGTGSVALATPDSAMQAEYWR